MNLLWVGTDNPLST